MEEKDNMQLPENAFRELKDGEEYKPLMSPDKVYPERNKTGAFVTSRNFAHN